MHRLFVSTTALVAVCLSSTAFAQDFAAEASRRMKLSFDLDEVAARIEEPWSRPVMTLPYASPLPLEPNSETDQVTVFPDRALVTRVLSAKVDKGTGAVTFEGLPLGLAADSLHAALREGDARIVGVELESGRGEVEQTARIEEIREDMLRRTDELGEIRDRIEALLAQRAYLRGALLSKPGEGASVTLSEVKGTLTYVGEAEADIARKLREEEKRAGELDEELSPLIVKLENPLATGMRVRVDVDAASADELTIALRYQVWGASWTPTYNARLDASSDEVTLEYYGVVTQSTGEDWTGASLSLSTANPSTSGSLPSLSPWYLGRNSSGYRTSVSDGLHTGAGYSVRSETVDSRRGGAGGVVSSDVTAAVRGGGTAVFAIPSRRDVAGDGSAVRLPIGTQTFSADVELATVPKVVPEVFRRATLINGGELPLLPGTVASYVGGDFVGSGYIGAVVPGEQLELSFGTDDRFKVTRSLVSREQEYVGPGKRTVRYTFEYQITVANFTDAAQLVELTDQLPIAEVEKVTVRELEVSEGREVAADDLPGMLRWPLSVEAGGEKSVTIRFSVTAPFEAGEPYVEELMHEMDLMF